jgi:chondroitin 4-sulfotransferase 11
MSVVNLDKNYYFIHVPKTGGTSMEEHVGGLAHYSYRTIKRLVPSIDNYFGFAFVRNPWTRVISSFYHKPNNDDRNVTNAYPKNPNGFKRFVKERMRPNIGYEKQIYWYPEYPSGRIHHHFLPQYFFLCDKEENIKVDFIGSLESINEDWSYVSSKIFGDVKHLTKMNKSNFSFDFMSHFDDEESNNIILEFYKKDFECFGYSKDPRDALKR